MREASRIFACARLPCPEVVLVEGSSAASFHPPTGVASVGRAGLWDTRRVRDALVAHAATAAAAAWCPSRAKIFAFAVATGVLPCAVEALAATRWEARMTWISAAVLALLLGLLFPSAARRVAFRRSYARLRRMVRLEPLDVGHYAALGFAPLG
jgi:hypothetical protein